jgi:hypothetical protein
MTSSQPSGTICDSQCARSKAAPPAAQHGSLASQIAFARRATNSPRGTSAPPVFGALDADAVAVGATGSFFLGGAEHARSASRRSGRERRIACTLLGRNLEIENRRKIGSRPAAYVRLMGSVDPQRGLT